MIMNIKKMKMEQILNKQRWLSQGNTSLGLLKRERYKCVTFLRHLKKFYANRIVGKVFSSLNLENTSSLKYLLAIKNDIMYKKFSGVINPPILDRWNWFVVIPQQFNRYANPCNLLTVLVPPVFIIKNYLLLIKNNIKKSLIIKKEKYEHQAN
jgi:hypothetical protein